MKRRRVKLIDALAGRRGEAEVQVGPLVRRHRMFGSADPETDRLVSVAETLGAIAQPLVAQRFNAAS